MSREQRNFHTENKLILERDQLRAKIERLTRERDKYDHEYACAHYFKLEAEAKVAKLMEALHKLDEACDDSNDACYGTLSTSFVRGIARAAIRECGGEVPLTKAPKE